MLSSIAGMCIHMLSVDVILNSYYSSAKSTCDKLSRNILEYLGHDAFLDHKRTRDNLLILQYHRGLSKGHLSRVLEKVNDGEARCIIATIAFGMGVDIPGNICKSLNYPLLNSLYPQTFGMYFCMGCQTVLPKRGK